FRERKGETSENSRVDDRRVDQAGPSIDQEYDRERDREDEDRDQGEPVINPPGGDREIDGVQHLERDTPKRLPPSAGRAHPREAKAVEGQPADRRQARRAAFSLAGIASRRCL